MALDSTEDLLPPAPDVRHLITDDGAAVHSFLAEKQMRLLVEPLHGWRAVTPDGRGGRPFVVAANVGVFAVPKNPAIVPDVFVSFDVTPRPVMGRDELRSYFQWEFGKPPDIVIEIVSGTDGGELSDKLRAYERMRVTHYVVFDPRRALSSAELAVFDLTAGEYVAREPVAEVIRFRAFGLGMRMWEGDYEGSPTRWLRFCDLDGVLIATGREDANAQGARADAERQRADEAEARAQALLARLQALGIDPEKP